MRLVVDASVLFAAGTSKAPVSSTSRAHLEMMERRGFGAAINQPILDEWNKHQSPWARKWRLRMTDRRLLIPVKPYIFRDLRIAIQTYLEDNARPVALKDVHLVETALQADHIVVSLDESARNLYCFLVDYERNLARIFWLNPLLDEHLCNQLGVSEVNGGYLTPPGRRADAAAGHQ